MSQTKKTYSLSKIKQLIDLNGDSTNFDLKFKVTCKDDSPFQVLVVDQTTLDNTETLEYKDVTGVISGNVIADKNVFQNHFLILKSDNQCEVDVEIIKTELPKTPDSVIQQQNQPVLNPQTQPIRHTSQGTSWLKIGLIALVIIGGGLLLWYLYKRKSPKTLHNDTHNYIEKHSFSVFNKDSTLPINNSPVNNSPVNNSSVNNSPVNNSPVNNSPIEKSSVHNSPVHNSPVHNSPIEKFYKPRSYKATNYENKTLSNVKTSKNNISPDIMSHMSSERSMTTGASSLLQRLRKFAR